MANEMKFPRTERFSEGIPVIELLLGMETNNE